MLKAIVILMFYAMFFNFMGWLCNDVEGSDCDPQVLSATATFTMLFSSSMSVLEYYLLGRFPVPYGKQ